MPVPPRWRRRLRSWVRRSSVAWWSAVSLLVLVTGVVVHSFATTAATQARRFGALQLVPVVATRVEAGAPLRADAVRMELRPGSTVPDGPATPAELAAEPTALAPLLPGEVVLSERLAPSGRRGAAALLAPGMRAVAVPSGPGGRPPADVGDRVDLLATFADPGTVTGGAPPTVVVAAAAVVLAVDPEADTVTVAVTPDELPAVVFAITTGTVTLALTSL